MNLPPKIKHDHDTIALDVVSTINALIAYLEERDKPKEERACTKSCPDYHGMELLHAEQCDCPCHQEPRAESWEEEWDKLWRKRGMTEEPNNIGYHGKQFILKVERAAEKRGREKVLKNVGMLRQLLNERPTESPLLTNEYIERVLLWEAARTEEGDYKRGVIKGI